jgi:rhomboid protease GluP
MHEARTVIRENWLTRRLDSRSAAVAAFMTLTLLFAGLVEWSDTWGAQAWMPATRAQVFQQHEYWRAWTTLFVHADLKHLLSNSMLFFILGSFLHGYFGWVAFPALAFLSGGAVNLLVLSGMKEEIKLIGVSGVVFWMGGFWLILYFLIDRRRSLTQRALRAAGVGLALFMPAEAFDPTISYAAHFFGFVAGVAVGLTYYMVRRAAIKDAEVREVILEEQDQEPRLEEPDR